MKKHELRREIDVQRKRAQDAESCAAKSEQDRVFAVEARDRSNEQVDFWMNVAKKADDKLARILRLDTPYPLQEVLTKLVGATHHLLHDHNCDGHGWEVISCALDSATSIAAELTDKANDTLAQDNLDSAEGANGFVKQGYGVGIAESGAMPAIARAT